MPLCDHSQGWNDRRAVQSRSMRHRCHERRACARARTLSQGAAHIVAPTGAATRAPCRRLPATRSLGAHNRAARRLGALSTHTQAPVGTQAAVVTDLLQALQIVARRRVNRRRCQVHEAARLVVLLPVEEPVGDLVLARVGHDGHQALKLLSRALASALVHVNLSLLAADVGKSAANTLDGREGVHDFLLAVHVGVQQTQNVLELSPDHEGTHLG
mmetsp:Transcript_20181/g.59905  ORF Transcript_20181/g.59905 Transcript_20181/m.59905 type:complete len:215 (-) Transcript_20181:20-664(-)